MVESYQGTPSPGVHTSEFVNPIYAHTQVYNDLEMINASQDTQFIAKFMQDVKGLKIKHFQRSFDWIATGTENPTQDTMRLGAWEQNLGLFMDDVRYEFTSASWATMMEDELNRSVAQIAKGYERLQVKKFWRQLLAIQTSATAGTDLQVQGGLYNGANTVTSAPPDWEGQTFASTHNHYNPSTAQTTDFGLADINFMVKDIRHHGGNGNFYTFMNSDGIEALSNMANFTTMQTPNPVIDDIATYGLKDRDTGVQIHGTHIMHSDWLPQYFYATLNDMTPLMARRVPPNPAAVGLQFQIDNPHARPELGSQYYCLYGHCVAEKGLASVMKAYTTSYSSPASTTGIMKYGWG